MLVRTTRIQEAAAAGGGGGTGGIPQVAHLPNWQWTFHPGEGVNTAQASVANLAMVMPFYVPEDRPVLSNVAMFFTAVSGTYDIGYGTWDGTDIDILASKGNATVPATATAYQSLWTPDADLTAQAGSDIWLAVVFSAAGTTYFRNNAASSAISTMPSAIFGARGTKLYGSKANGSATLGGSLTSITTLGHLPLMAVEFTA